MEELAKTTDDSLDVVVTLLPQNLAIREIRYTEANTIFLYDDHDTDKFRAICRCSKSEMGQGQSCQARKSWSQSTG